MEIVDLLARIFLSGLNLVFILYKVFFCLVISYAKLTFQNLTLLFISVILKLIFTVLEIFLLYLFGIHTNARAPAK